MKSSHRVTNVYFKGASLHLTIDGHAKRFPLREISPRLFQATEGERQRFEVSPSGYGIHWPLLDEDLSIDGLLGIVHTPPKKVKSA